MAQVKRTSKKIKNQRKKDRVWKHWLRWLGKPPYWDNLVEYKNYDPEKFRESFENFQTHGPKSLTGDELVGIQPLISGQNQKEFFLTGVCEECLDFWSHNAGWIHPLRHSISLEKDRLTKVALLKIEKRIKQEGAETFLLNHPRISVKQKEMALARKWVD